jgi:phosphate transport system substrate-binding protein
MNDEFLHALRREPPPEFASELKRRLLRQPARRNLRSSFMRGMLALFLIGGVAMAAALLLRDRSEPPAEAAPAAQAIAPKPVARMDQAEVPERTAAPSDGNVSPAPHEITQTVPKEIPIALATSELAQPLAMAVVGHVTRSGHVAQPRVLTMDDDLALRAVCGNSDFAFTSRRISDSELAQCQKWGVDILEWKLGYQAVVLTAAPTTELTALEPREVFLALARRIPDPAEPSRLIDNPNATWHDVDARFDYRTIDVLMPPNATTRKTFLRLVMEAGCDTFPWIRKLRSDRPRYEDICHELRTDGRFREVELTGTLITQRLWAEPNWLIVLDYSYYAAHRSELMSTLLTGPAPTLGSLTDGTYAAARPVYVYAQRRQLDENPAARRLAQHLSDQSAMGPQEYLVRVGLVPPDERPRRIPAQRPQLPPPLETLQP